MRRRKLKLKHNWLYRFVKWGARWIWIGALVSVYGISMIGWRISKWMLSKHGIQLGEVPERPQLKVLQGGKSKPEWVKEGKAKDGMRVETNRFTGKQRVVVESTGQVLPIDLNKEG